MNPKREFKDQGEIIDYLRSATDELLDYIMRSQNSLIDPRQVKLTVAQGLNAVFHKGAAHGVYIHAEKVKP